MATLKLLTALPVIFACTSGTAQPPDALEPPEIVSLLSKELEIPGKEMLMMTVEYPPGGGDPVHRHDAHAFIYVLEGSIIMQVRGGDQVTLTAGQTFYEGPDDLHTVGRNVSTIAPAKFLVIQLKNIGVAPLIPAEQ